MQYLNRQDAGKRLAKALKQLRLGGGVVLGLPRGGVAVGAEVAQELSLPFGIVLVRKLGHPAYPEFAIGAIAEDEDAIYDEDEILGMDEAQLRKAEIAARERILEQRILYYGYDVEPLRVKGKTVILIDDGIATGHTMEAAVRAVIHNQAQRVIVAAPVASIDSVTLLENIADKVLVLGSPEDFRGSVSAHYKDFGPVEDSQVAALLRTPNRTKL
jgi:putative phosphoribosyl transferase